MTKKLIGLDPDQVPVNGFLGDAAYFDSEHLPLSNQAKPLHEAFAGFENLVAERPSLMLDFVRSETLPGRVQFTRSSDATYFDRTGKLRTAGPNQPRIEFDPVTGKCLGLLVEGQATNLLRWSEDFLNANGWTESIHTFSDNLFTAPDGSGGLKTFIPNAGASWAAIQSLNVTAPKNIQRTVSVYVLPLGFRYVHVRMNAFDGNSLSAFLDTQTGETNSTQSGNAVVAGVVAQKLSNGWWRLALSGTPNPESDLSGMQCGFGPAYSLTSSTGYTANGVDGVCFWGAQLEEGSAPTSYIKTEASQVTRAAESTAISTANFPYNEGEGTLLIEANASPVHRFWDGYLTLSSAQNNYVGIFAPANIAAVRAQIMKVGDTGQPTASVPTTTGARFVAAMSFSRAGARVSFDGGAVAPVGLPAAGLPEGLTHLGIGQYYPQPTLTRKYIRRVTYYPRAFPDAQLVEFSSTGGTHD